MKNYECYSCFVQKKTAGQNTKYSRNETNLKNGHLARAITHAKALSSLGKMLSLGQKLKMPKRYEKRFFKNVRVVLCKKLLEKKPHVREMRQF